MSHNLGAVRSTAANEDTVRSKETSKGGTQCSFLLRQEETPKEISRSKHEEEGGEAG